MSEAIYDEKIAPMLAEVSKLCHQHDLPMFAVVEYEPGHYGETAVQTPKQSLAMSMTHMASRARGNLDAFVISLLRFCNKQGINTDASMVANRMTGRTAGVLVGPRWQEDMRARLNEATTHLQANRWTPAFQSVQDALGLLDAAGVNACPKGKGECSTVSPDKRCFDCPCGVQEVPRG